MNFMNEFHAGDQKVVSALFELHWATTESQQWPDARQPMGGAYGKQLREGQREDLLYKMLDTREQRTRLSEYYRERQAA